MSPQRALIVDSMKELTCRCGTVVAGVSGDSLLASVEAHIAQQHAANVHDRRAAGGNTAGMAPRTPGGRTRTVIQLAREAEPRNR